MFPRSAGYVNKITRRVKIVYRSMHEQLAEPLRVRAQASKGRMRHAADKKIESPGWVWGDPEPGEGERTAPKQ